MQKQPRAFATEDNKPKKGQIKTSVLEVLNGLELLYNDLNNLIVDYSEEKQIKGAHLFEWNCPYTENFLQTIVHDDQYLYINCAHQREIYCYSLDGKLINSLNYYAWAMEIVNNNQLYLMNISQFFIVDLKINSVIQSWDLPKENNESVGGLDLKVDKEQIYFTLQKFHYVYLFNINGKEIKKFGKKEKSKENGEFNDPAGITVNEKYLYVCDYSNHRVQILDKENGNFIDQWKCGQRFFNCPQSILLYEYLFYVGDENGIQVFTKDSRCIQLIGNSGSGEGEFGRVTGLCFVHDKLYIVDQVNNRMQVWN